MMVARIEDATRVIGKSQGYLGLPVRDNHMKCTVGGEFTPTMTTAWHPTPDELAALNAGAAVHVMLVGKQHPPIMVLVGSAPDPAV